MSVRELGRRERGWERLIRHRINETYHVVQTICFDTLCVAQCKPNITPLKSYILYLGCDTWACRLATVLYSMYGKCAPQKTGAQDQWLNDIWLTSWCQCPSCCYCRWLNATRLANHIGSSHWTKQHHISCAHYQYIVVGADMFVCLFHPILKLPSPYSHFTFGTPTIHR